MGDHADDLIDDGFDQLLDEWLYDEDVEDTDLEFED